jgi:WD40 repeat protein
MFNDSSAKYLATASKDQTIKFWKIDYQKSGKKPAYNVVQHSNLVGHVNSVESLTFNGDNIILSGDYNGNIFGWSTTINADNVEETSVKKKSKGNNSLIEMIFLKMTERISFTLQFKICNKRFKLHKIKVY